MFYLNPYTNSQYPELHYLQIYTIEPVVQKTHLEVG